jgi:hypothetical protein
MWSDFPCHVRISAHDWGQLLMFEGKSRSLFGSFTRIACCLLIGALLPKNSSRSMQHPEAQQAKGSPGKDEPYRVELETQQERE